MSNARKSISELNRIPTEFHENGAPELPELPDEFNRFPKMAKRKEDRSHLRKVMLLLAVTGLVLLGVLLPVSRIEPPASAEVIVPAASATPLTSAGKTDEPVETPVPTPEPEPLPDLEAIYFFTHSVSNAVVVLSDPAHTTSVHVRIWEDQVKDSLLEYDLSAEEIAKGTWEYTGIDMNDFYWNHREEFEAMDYGVHLVLYATATYRTEDGTEGTVTRTAETTAEDYAYVEYNDSRSEPNDWTFPGCFSARVYDAQIDPVLFTTDPDRELLPGEFFVSVTVNGERIPEENCWVKRIEDVYEYEGETFYNYSFYFIMQKPDSFPEHGTAHITIRQRLIHSDYIREREEDLDY